MLPHSLPPNTIAFLAEFVPNSFKNQSNDEISIEKLHSSNLSSYPERLVPFLLITYRAGAAFGGPARAKDI